MQGAKDEGEEEKFNKSFKNTKFLKSLFACINLYSGLDTRNRENQFKYQGIFLL